MFDKTDLCAPGSDETGTIFGTLVLMGLGLVEDIVKVFAPVWRLAGIDL